ncbi:ABC transporter [Aphelenchoides avenae]|nr:ABC transporter [Aphelenchus avenae]
MNLHLWHLVLFAFILIDLTFSIGALGFYQLDFAFSKDKMLEKLLLTDGYHFCTGGIEFVVLAVFRSLVLIVGTIVSLYVNVPPLKLLFLDLVLWNTSFGLVEALAFSELPHQLSYCGIWLNIAWNWLAFPVAHALWHRVVSGKPTSRRRSSEYSRFDDDTDADLEAGNLRPPAGQQASEEPSTFRVFFRLISYCRFHPKMFGLGFTFLLTYSTATAFVPYFAGQVIASTTVGMEAFMRNVMILTVLGIISTIAGGLRGGCFDYATSLVNRRIRRDLFNSIMRQDIAFFDEQSTGQVVSRLTTDCQLIATTMSTDLNILLRDGIMIILSIILMIDLSWRLAMVTVIAVPPMFFFQKMFAVHVDVSLEQLTELRA